jgi:flagellar biosynthesis chaperone FliJ
MNPRMKRAVRLVGLAEKAQNSARARAVDAARAVVDCDAEAQRLEAVWVTATHGFARGVSSAADLVLQAAHLRTLRLRADAAAKRLEKARSDERAAAELLLEAARDRRKLELWQERLQEAEREQASRLERGAADDLAARAVRGRP